MGLFRQFTYKKFGILPFDASAAAEVNKAVYHSYIKNGFITINSHNSSSNSREISKLALS